MEKNFVCDASRLAWELYKYNPQELGLLSLHLSLEYDYDLETVYENGESKKCDEHSMEL